MALIQNANTTSTVTIGPTSKAARITLYDTVGRETSRQFSITYSTVNTFTPPATPSDMVRITGSTTKTVRLVSIYFASSNTLGGVSQTLFLIKRFNFNQGGTFVTSTAVPHDSADVAATAVVGHYTANPTFLGNTAGTIVTSRLAVPAVTPTSFAGVAEDAGIELLPWGGISVLDKLLTLRGADESFVVNFGGAALLTGQVHAYRVTWIEE